MTAPACRWAGATGEGWPCTLRASWRVSVAHGDPWPLEYACPEHLGQVITSLGGDCRVTRLEAGQRYPEPRA